jgi:hypothetical protein
VIDHKIETRGETKGNMFHLEPSPRSIEEIILKSELEVIHDDNKKSRMG